MTVLDILGVWNLFMTRQFIPVYTMVYTAPRLKLPALPCINTCMLDQMSFQQDVVKLSNFTTYNLTLELSSYR